MNKLPIENFAVQTKSIKEAGDLGEIQKEHYPEYSVHVNFNASSTSHYYVKNKRWEHATSCPTDITEIYTLAEFKQKFLTKPEIIDDYQIY